MLHRVFARAEQVGDGGMNHDAEHQAGAFDPRPQLLDVVEAVLFGAGEVAIDAGVREVRDGFLVEYVFRFLKFKVLPGLERLVNREPKASVLSWDIRGGERSPR